MKATVVAFLAIAATTVLAHPYFSDEESSVYARDLDSDLFERGFDEDLYELQRRRRATPGSRGRGSRGRSGPSLSKAFANAAGVVGGEVAGVAGRLALGKAFAPPQQPPPQPPQRRALQERARGRGGSLSRARSGSRFISAGAKEKGKGIATSFLGGFANGFVERGLDNEVLDELD